MALSEFADPGKYIDKKNTSYDKLFQKRIRQEMSALDQLIKETNDYLHNKYSY